MVGSTSAAVAGPIARGTCCSRTGRPAGARHLKSLRRLTGARCEHVRLGRVGIFIFLRIRGSIRQVRLMHLVPMGHRPLDTDHVPVTPDKHETCYESN